MGDSVPDWEEMCGATEVGISLDSLEHLLKEKWETVELTSEIANLPSMSGHDSNQGAWGDSTNRTGLRTINVEHTDLHRSSLWRREIPLAVTFPEPPSGILVPDVKKCFDGTFNLPTSQEDEMVSWLQYPLEDSLEKECYGVSRKSPGCSFAPPKDIAGDHSSLDFQQNVVGFPRMKKMAAGKEGDAVLGEPQVRESIPEDESEVLTRVRAVRPLVPKGLDLECSGEVVALGLNSASSQHFSTPGMASPMQTSAMEALGSASMLNFPHFSRPAAVVKANLHSLGVSCVPTSQSSQSRLRQSIACTPSALLDPLLALSSMSPNMGLCSPSKSARFGEVLRGTTTQSDSHQQPSDERSGLDTTSCACDVPGKCAISSCFACPTLICDSHQQQLRSKSLETSEATFSSGGSGVSIVQGAKSTTQRIKRKLVEEECPGEDAEDESVDAKRPSSVRSTVTKRSRAAEVHNLSERRRRDRINEKMRALQDLIPNSNKTDKASMLDEAIEYLKMLQLQLKMMSMRSGITLPSMILPPGSPRSRSPLSSVDQGASMESGKHTIFGGGLGWTNLTVPGQRLVPSLCGSTHIFPASTPDDQLRKSVNVDTWNTCLGRPDLQAGNVERYNNSMRLQQQHHHHHQALHESQYQQ